MADNWDIWCDIGCIPLSPFNIFLSSIESSKTQQKNLELDPSSWCPIESAVGTWRHPIYTFFVFPVRAKLFQFWWGRKQVQRVLCLSRQDMVPLRVSNNWPKDGFELHRIRLALFRQIILSRCEVIEIETFHKNVDNPTVTVVVCSWDLSGMLRCTAYCETIICACNVQFNEHFILNHR